MVIIHHSVFDGWSASIFYRELVSLYAAFSNGSAFTAYLIYRCSMPIMPCGSVRMCKGMRSRHTSTTGNASSQTRHCCSSFPRIDHVR